MVRIIEQELRTIKLPSVLRPSVAPDDPATEELVQWAITAHVYAEIAHIRTILAGFLMLADSGNSPSASILARHIFEWTALACHLMEKLSQHVPQKDWQAAWDLVLKVGTANSWVKNHGHNYGPADSFKEEVESPIRIKHLIASYTRYHTAKYGKTRIEDSYGYLSEFCHPNANCLMEYQEFDGARAYFVPPRKESTYSGINGFSAEWLLFVQDLLRLAEEAHVRQKLIKTIQLITADGESTERT
jgi:hypothetical protein